MVVLAVLLLLGDRWGPHGDELYFRMLPLDWWYEDQPPLTVWLTHAGAALGAPWGDPLWVQRAPAALGAAAGALLAAALPRAQGHGRGVQALSAWAHATTVYPLILGHVLLTASLDLLAWQAVVLGVVVAARGRRRGLVWAGLAAGAGCWNKLLVLPLAGALFLALLISRRDLLRTRETGLGAAAALALGLPQLLAQAAHGWPMRAVAADLAAQNGALNRWLVLPLLAAFLSPAFLGVCWRGLRWTAPARKDDAARGPGLLLPAGAVLVLWNLVSPGQPYYAVGLFLTAVSLGWGPLLAASVRSRRRRRSGRRPWSPRRAAAVVAVNAVLAGTIALPLVPVSSPAFDVVASLNPTLRAQTGWQQDAALVDRARGSRDTTVVTDSYALAGAVDRYRAADGARIPVASGHNALWRSGPPRTEDVLLVGRRAVAERGRFARCEDAGTLAGAPRDPYGVAGSPMLRCRGPVGGWAAVWPAFRHLGA